METIRCGQFSLDVEIVLVQGTPVTLRVPVRRCALAERMIALISKTPEGRVVARKLTLDASSRQFLDDVPEGAGEIEIDASVVRAGFGPDLDVIHSAECTVQRCQESCTPHFKLILQQFGYAEDARKETGAGCRER